MPFEFRPLALPDVILVVPRVFGDARGSFMESYRRAEFEKAGVQGEFIQDNVARSKERGVLRGLHFQREPHAQAKLVRCARGRIYDVAVDIRPHSPTFGRFVAKELLEEDSAMLYVPRGFAHGYQTLTEFTEVVYKVDAEYAPSAEGGVIWNDCEIAIPWPIANPSLSDRDRTWPTLQMLAKVPQRGMSI